tara:strand:+ start:767 stop:1147 length:381 start_codon:yes stop_codon:yes gene_type:complete
MNEEEIEEFKKIVVNWVQIDDVIREKNAELKELKDDKKSLEEYILESMDKMDQSIIDISDGKLRLNKSKTTAGIKQEYIQEALTELVKDQAQAQQMTKFILEKRPTVERTNLKRTFFRKKKPDKST